MTKKKDEQLAQMMADLQRVQADFENYRKRVEQEKIFARDSAQANTILKLLPTIDSIERATRYMPPELADNPWAQGIARLEKSLEKSLEALSVHRIDAKPGTIFNPELHEAIQLDEDAEGEHEVIAEELQAGYTLNGVPMRHAMVKVTRQNNA
ncbi:nucleotide exchange factor GrpE [Candidatus Saccharibacteria bacterium]|nr:nucleotide exchange factor GrpE [Candidatus Saccharibacteria bacterium]